MAGVLRESFEVREMIPLPLIAGRELTSDWKVINHSPVTWLQLPIAIRALGRLCDSGELGVEIASGLFTSV